MKIYAREHGWDSEFEAVVADDLTAETWELTL
jgi:hypothetical protein